MCHVLIIEDEMLVAMHLQSVLGEEGAMSFAFASTEWSLPGKPGGP